jgi:uroporphyrinogen-III synthase
MNDRPATGKLSGRRIALPETRELDRLAGMLEEQRAETLRCPMVAIRDTPDAAPVREWLTRFPFDDLVLFTGEGLRRLYGFAQRFRLEQGFLDGLRVARKITRGPKPERALRELGLKSDTRRRADHQGSDCDLIGLRSMRAPGGGAALPVYARYEVRRFPAKRRG